jgi:hypothetical protein
MRGEALALAMLALALRAADDLPKWVVDLAHIQRTMGDELKRLPNYTCSETIDRYKAQGAEKLRRIDQLRLNVAVVNRKELYAWPGGDFQDISLPDMVRNGFIADGSFSSMAHTVFANRGVRTSFAGEQTQQGRRLVRYRFTVSAAVANWDIRLGTVAAQVGASGWFEADASTLDVTTLEIAAEDLPSWLLARSLVQTTQYSRVLIGSREVLLPRLTELRSESFGGEKLYNRTAIGDCREFGSQTTITFDEPH